MQTLPISRRPSLAETGTRPRSLLYGAGDERTDAPSDEMVVHLRSDASFDLDQERLFDAASSAIRHVHTRTSEFFSRRGPTARAIEQLFRVEVDPVDDAPGTLGVLAVHPLRELCPPRIVSDVCSERLLGKAEPASYGVERSTA